MSATRNVPPTVPDGAERRKRVQLSARVACTFVGTANPPMVHVYWHGDADPARLRGLALARYRRERDAFIEGLALEARQSWLVGETVSGYVRALGLASCEP